MRIANLHHTPLFFCDSSLIPRQLAVASWAAEFSVRPSSIPKRMAPASAIVLATFRVLPQHFLALAPELLHSVSQSSAPPPRSLRHLLPSSKPHKDFKTTALPPSLLRSLARSLLAFLSHFLNVIKAIRRPSSTF